VYVPAGVLDVVWIVSVELAEPAPGVTPEGANAQEVDAGRPRQDNQIVLP
jgi:hypothetical protein